MQQESKQKQEKTTRKLILVGPAASGKSELWKHLCRTDESWKPCISYTTRLQRTNEINGQDYHFISRDMFEKMWKTEHLFEEVQQFNGWFYGKTKNDMANCNLFICTPSAVLKMTREYRNSCFVVYLKTDPSIRKQRLESRLGTQDSVQRRMKADQEDFAQLPSGWYDAVLENNSDSLRDLYLHWNQMWSAVGVGIHS